ncbi:replication initiator protein A [Bradyrhizobium macuxiense]|nr:replication initiator protein A [Bradyrhizobium macuxiense]
MRRKQHSKRDQLELFRALLAELAPRDEQDLMAYPFVPLARDIVPIDFSGDAICDGVEAAAAHGVTTICDVDVLMWAAPPIVEAGDVALVRSRLTAAMSYATGRIWGNCRHPAGLACFDNPALRSHMFLAKLRSHGFQSQSQGTAA